MATEKSMVILERITKIDKGAPVTTLKEVKTDGTIQNCEKEVARLQKSRVPYFEVLDQKNIRKTG